VAGAIPFRAKNKKYSQIAQGIGQILHLNMGLDRSVLTENRRMKYCCTVLIALFVASFSLFSQEDPPLPGVFYLEIRQTVEPEEFPQRQLRVYRMQGEALTILIEGFDDPEAEVSVNRVLSKTCYNEILQEAERNRLMAVGTDCVAYTPVARPSLKTELKIQYKGETKVCYSYDKPFVPALQQVLQKLNTCIPNQDHKVILPQRSPQLD
jgi:hypothetical protein